MNFTSFTIRDSEGKEIRTYLDKLREALVFYNLDITLYTRVDNVQRYAKGMPSLVFLEGEIFFKDYKEAWTFLQGYLFTQR